MKKNVLLAGLLGLVVMSSVVFHIESMEGESVRDLTERARFGAEALFQLGEKHLSEGVNQDREKALFYFEQAAHLSIHGKVQVNAWLMLGQNYYLIKEYDKALNYANKASEQNKDPFARAGAQKILGKMYLFGQGVKQSYKTAKRYFELVANQKDNLFDRATALFRLGEIYIKEIDSGGSRQAKRDLGQQAKRYLEKAEKQDDNLGIKAFAQVKLGSLYLYGVPGTIDHQEAMSYVLKASKQNHNPEAKVRALLLLKDIRGAG